MIIIKSYIKAFFIFMSLLSIPVYSSEDTQTIDEYILEAIELSVWGGFNSPEDVNQMVSDILEDGANEAMLRQAIKLEFAKKHKAEKSWPKITDYNRLDMVFSKLRNKGVLCLHNAGMTTQDGHDDSTEALTKYPKSKFFGYCFYHQQDLDRAITGQGLLLAFDHIKGDVPEKLNIALAIKKELEAAKFKIEWDGTTKTRIKIPQIDWKHRSPE